MQQRSNNRKDLIFENAKKLFIEQGYNDVSLRKIANLCGTSATAIEKHFNSKQNLAIKIIYDFIDNILAIASDFSKEHFHDEDKDFRRILFIWSLHYNIMLIKPNFAKFYYECRQNTALNDKLNINIRVNSWLKEVFSSFDKIIEGDELDTFLKESTSSYVDIMITTLCSKNAISLCKAIEFWLSIASLNMKPPADHISVSAFLKEYEKEIQQESDKLLKLSGLEE